MNYQTQQMLEAMTTIAVMAMGFGIMRPLVLQSRKLPLTFGKEDRGRKAYNFLLPYLRSVSPDIELSTHASLPDTYKLITDGRYMYKDITVFLHVNPVVGEVKDSLGTLAHEIGHDLALEKASERRGVSTEAQTKSIGRNLLKKWLAKGVLAQDSVIGARKPLAHTPSAEFFHITDEANLPSILRRGLDPPVSMVKGRDMLDRLLSEGMTGAVLRIKLPPDWSVFPDEAWEEFYKKGMEPVYVYSDKRVQPNMIVVERIIT